MLTLETQEVKVFDKERREFIIRQPRHKLRFEHSLVSMSKWESKYHKSFVNTDKTPEEYLDYFKLMLLSQEDYDNVDMDLLTEEDYKTLINYISDSHTATTFSDESSSASRKPHSNVGNKITTEVIYGWMVKFKIPFECQYWHYGRLMALIRVCIYDNLPPKKMSLSERRQLNNARKAKRHTKG